MNRLRPALAGYLDLRRGLGFKLDRDAKLLDQFISYLEETGAASVTAADALAWATLPAGASPGWLAFRMSVARGFAAYLHTLDPAAEVPPRGLLPGRTRRAVPYLYSAADIAALLTQAERLRTPQRTATIQTLTGLLMVTGLFSGDHLVRRRSVPRVCAAQRLIEERYRLRQVWCKDDARRVIGVVSRC